MGELQILNGGAQGVQHGAVTGLAGPERELTKRLNLA